MDAAAPRASLLSSAVAGLAVFAACVLAMPPGWHWLDAGEFVASAHGLGISHPPGHPVAAVLGKAISLLLPFGSVAFRVSVASALALGGATALAAWLARGAGPVVAGACAIAVGWCGPALLQGVRAEVYALNALLCLGALAALTAGPPTPRSLAVAGLLGGLGLANHHLLALAALVPAALVVLPGRVRPAGAAAGLAAAALGLCAYALLPVRALHDPVADWGDPRTPGRLWWTVSAQAFQRLPGDGRPPDLLASAAEASFVLMDAVGPLAALVGLVGLIGWARRYGRAGAALLVAATGAVATQVMFGFDPHNPDVLGYWLPAMLLCGTGVAALLGDLRAAGRRAGVVAAALALAFAATRWGAGGRGLPPRDSEDPRRAADIALAAVPPHGVALVADFNLLFSLWATEAVEAARPDAAVVARPFLGHPGYADHVVRREPALGPWPGAVAQDPCPPGPPGRPFRIELHPDQDDACLASLPPAAVIPPGDRIDRVPDADLPSARWVTWQHWQHARHGLARGDRPAARRHLDAARRRAEGSPELAAIEAALSAPGVSTPSTSDPASPGR